MKDTRKNRSETAISAVSADIASATATQTIVYNNECTQYRTSLAKEAASNAESLSEKLAKEATYVGDRSKGVALAYKYEQADVIMGGKGSARWNASESAELLSTGKVRNCEGHHIKSVAEHPSQQTNPNNIRFYRSYKEHLYDGHNGNFRNPTSGELIDKDAMLKATNAKRVLANEAKGVGYTLAFATATGVGASIYNTCRIEGFNVNSVKKGVKRSTKPVAVSCVTALVSYATVRILSSLFK